MEEILEFVLTVFEALFDGIKKPKVRRWALTGFWSVTFIFFAGICLQGHIDALKDEAHIGAMIMGILTALVLAFAAFFIIRGHRRNWKKMNY